MTVLNGAFKSNKVTDHPKCEDLKLELKGQAFEKEELILPTFVFENERRSLIPPFNFGDNLSFFERGKFSDEEGEKTVLHADVLKLIGAPLLDFSDHDWIWCFDTEYTQCDEEGWSYGFDFLNLMSNCKKESSVTDSKLQPVRRRRWTMVPKDQHLLQLQLQQDQAAAAAAARESLAVNAAEDSSSSPRDKGDPGTMHCRLKLNYT